MSKSLNLVTITHFTVPDCPDCGAVSIDYEYNGTGPFNVTLFCTCHCSWESGIWTEEKPTPESSEMPETKTEGKS